MEIDDEEDDNCGILDDPYGATEDPYDSIFLTACKDIMRAQSEESCAPQEAVSLESDDEEISHYSDQTPPPIEIQGNELSPEVLEKLRIMEESPESLNSFVICLLNMTPLEDLCEYLEAYRKDLAKENDRDGEE